MVKVSLTGAILLLQSFKSIVIVAVSPTVCAGLASEYHAVASPGETPMLEQVCPEELDEAGAETAAGLEFEDTGVGEDVGTTVFIVGIGIGENVGMGAKLG